MWYFYMFFFYSTNFSSYSQITFKIQEKPTTKILLAVVAKSLNVSKEWLIVSDEYIEAWRESRRERNGGENAGDPLN